MAPNQQDSVIGKSQALRMTFDKKLVIFDCDGVLIDSEIIAAVSYTHLDVYKRQALCCGANQFALDFH